MCGQLVEGLTDARTRPFARDAILSVCGGNEPVAKRIADLYSRQEDPEARGLLLALVLEVTDDSSLLQRILSEGTRDDDVYVRIFAERKRRGEARDQ